MPDPRRWRRVRISATVQPGRFPQSAAYPGRVPLRQGGRNSLLLLLPTIE